ncbi:MAG: hypothetical protein IJH07_02980 [Ruminococcus sp.]|nr:hypothetical protein [Ruminococcus sp.]
MYNLTVFIDEKTFGSKNAEVVMFVRAALDIFNEKIVVEQCQIDDFAVVEAEKRKGADVVISCARRGLNHRDRQLLHRLNPSIILVPLLSVTDGNTVILDIGEMQEVALNYDYFVTEIITEAVCSELCFLLGAEKRVSKSRMGSKESQADFGLMLTPYNVYNAKLNKALYLFPNEVEALKTAIAAKVA